MCRFGNTLSYLCHLITTGAHYLAAGAHQVAATLDQLTTNSNDATGDGFDGLEQCVENVLLQFVAIKTAVVAVAVFWWAVVVL